MFYIVERVSTYNEQIPKLIPFSILSIVMVVKYTAKYSIFPLFVYRSTSGEYCGIILRP